MLLDGLGLMLSGLPGLGGRGPSPGKGAPEGNWSSWPPGPGLKPEWAGMRGGRLIGSGCSIEVGAEIIERVNTRREQWGAGERSMR